MTAPERIWLLIEPDIKQGLVHAAIAAKHGLSVGQVENALYTCGRACVGRYFVGYEAVDKMIADGRKAPEISVATGVHVSTVFGRIRRLKLRAEMGRTDERGEDDILFTQGPQGVIKQSMEIKQRHIEASGIDFRWWLDGPAGRQWKREIGVRF